MAEMKRTLGDAVGEQMEATAVATVPVVVRVEGASDDAVFVLTDADWDGELLILGVREEADPKVWGLS